MSESNQIWYPCLYTLASKSLHGNIYFKSGFSSQSTGNKICKVSNTLSASSIEDLSPESKTRLVHLPLNKTLTSQLNQIVFERERSGDFVYSPALPMMFGIEPLVAPHPPGNSQQEQSSKWK